MYQWVNKNEGMNGQKWLNKNEWINGQNEWMKEWKDKNEWTKMNE